MSRIPAQIKKLPRGTPLHILKRRSQDSKGKGEGGPGVTSLFEPKFHITMNTFPIKLVLPSALESRYPLTHKSVNPGRLAKIEPPNHDAKFANLDSWTFTSIVDALSPILQLSFSRSLTIRFTMAVFNPNAS